MSQGDDQSLEPKFPKSDLLWPILYGLNSQFFRKSLEKSQRFQNLQNVFIQKEIQEFNRDLETQGIW